MVEVESWARARSLTARGRSEEAIGEEEQNDVV